MMDNKPWRKRWSSYWHKNRKHKPLPNIPQRQSYFTTGEMAEALGLSEKTIREQVRKGKITVLVGGTKVDGQTMNVLIPIAEIIRYAKQNAGKSKNPNFRYEADLNRISLLRPGRRKKSEGKRKPIRALSLQ